MNAMTELKNLRMPLYLNGAGMPKYRQIDVEYDPELRAFWTFMKPAGTACFNLGLLEDIRSNDKQLEANGGAVLLGGQRYPVDFYVGASRTENVFNYGGDLALFVLLI